MRKDGKAQTSTPNATLAALIARSDFLPANACYGVSCRSTPGYDKTASPPTVRRRMLLDKHYAAKKDPTYSGLTRRD